jgi:excisionase family DNA binding protein
MARRTNRATGNAKDAPVSERAGSRDRRQRIQFFTIAETASMLAVNARTVRRRIASGELVVHHFGTAVRIADSDLRAFLAIHRDT